MLDHTRCAAYQPDLGFAIAVDRAYGLVQEKSSSADAGPAANNFLYKVVTAVSPPGLYLRTAATVAEDAQFTLNQDLDAAVHAPRFLDGPRRFRDKAKAPNLTAFFEIRTLNVVRDKAEGVVVGVAPDRRYWAALPLVRRPSRPNAFLRGASYTDSGAFVLPIFRGPVPESLLDAAHVGDTIVQRLTEAHSGTKGGAAKRRKSQASSGTASSSSSDRRSAAPRRCPR